MCPCVDSFMRLSIPAPIIQFMLDRNNFPLILFLPILRKSVALVYVVCHWPLKWNIRGSSCGSTCPDLKLNAFFPSGSSVANVIRAPC